MDDRIEELRHWWDRTRRRRLSARVQSAVERVRPQKRATESAPAIVPTPMPSEPADQPTASDAAKDTAAPVNDSAIEAGEVPGTAAPQDPDVDVALAAADPAEPHPDQAEPDPDQAQPDPEPHPDPEPDRAAPGPLVDAAGWDSSREAGAPPEADPTPGPEGGLDAGTSVETADDAADRTTGPSDPPVAEEAIASDLAGAAPRTALSEEPDEPAPEIMGEPDPAPRMVAPAHPAAEPGGEPSAEAHAPDPWSGITWSPGDQPAPWSPPPDAAADTLGLDDDQRRWLGRELKGVESIGPGYGAQLEAIGVRTLQELLLRGATRRGRQEIADATGISGKLIMRWVNNADLFRIRGIGPHFAELLEAAGVDTVVELGLRRPGNLAARLATTNEIRSLVGQVPAETQVTEWVRQARELPRIVTY